MQIMSGVAYEDDIKDLPSAPDVGNYLVSEVFCKTWTDSFFCWVFMV